MAPKQRHRRNPASIGDAIDPAVRVAQIQARAAERVAELEFLSAQQVAHVQAAAAIDAARATAQASRSGGRWAAAGPALSAIVVAILCWLTGVSVLASSPASGGEGQRESAAVGIVSANSPMPLDGYDMSETETDVTIHTAKEAALRALQSIVADESELAEHRIAAGHIILAAQAGKLYCGATPSIDRS